MIKKILIVDNDSGLQFLLSQILSDAGYETFSLLDGELGLETIGQFRPNLILLDVMIGNVDGRNLCKLIKKAHGMKVIPVILVSGVDDLSSSIGHEGGPDDVIVKPFDLGYLLNRVAFFLNAKSKYQPIE